MRDINLTLECINNANERYRVQNLSLVADQSTILRDLSVSYYDLIEHKREAREQWLNAYNSHKGSHAAKERFADSEVMEYDTIRDLLKAVSMQIDAIRSTISANK